MDHSEMIVIDPEVRSGKPYVAGTRMTVGDVLEYLASGMTVEEVVANFPYLTREGILACLAFSR